MYTQPRRPANSFGIFSEKSAGPAGTGLESGFSGRAFPRKRRNCRADARPGKPGRFACSMDGTRRRQPIMAAMIVRASAARTAGASDVAAGRWAGRVTSATPCERAPDHWGRIRTPLAATPRCRVSFYYGLVQAAYLADAAGGGCGRRTCCLYARRCRGNDGAILPRIAGAAALHRRRSLVPRSALAREHHIGAAGGARNRTLEDFRRARKVHGRPGA